MSIPIPRLIGLLDEMREREGPLLIDEIYEKVLQKERIRMHERAKSVILRVLVLGAVKTNKNDIYLF